MNVVLALLIAPVILAVVNHLLSRASKREDWRRQDEVARKVETAADELKAANKTTAAVAAHVVTALEVSDSHRADLVATVAESTASTEAKLAEVSANQDRMIVMIDGDYTARMVSQLSALELALAGLQELTEWRRQAGDEPSEATLALIASKEKEIEQLRRETVARLKVTKAAELTT